MKWALCIFGLDIILNNCLFICIVVVVDPPQADKQTNNFFF